MKVYVQFTTVSVINTWFTYFYFAPLGLQSIVISLFVHLSVRSRNLKTMQPNLPNFLCVSRGCGSVLHWRHCDMLCTSSFTDDIMFSYHGTYRQTDDVTLCTSSLVKHGPLWVGRPTSLQAVLLPRQAHLDEQFLQFSGLGFVTVGPCHCAMCIIVSIARWTWWDWSLILRTYLPSVLWCCWLGHLTHKNPSLIWPIMCLVGR